MKAEDNDDVYFVANQIIHSSEKLVQPSTWIQSINQENGPKPKCVKLERLVCAYVNIYIIQSSQTDSLASNANVSLVIRKDKLD